MSKIYVIGIDGSKGCIRAAEYAAEHAVKANASIKLLHVLQWSPYSFLTPEELGERHKRRSEELHRAQTALIEPMIKRLATEGLTVEGEARYGEIAEVIHNYSEEVGATHAFLGRHGDSGLMTRIFGSVPAALIQVSTIPVTVVP
jgi:nucleotide-binding universal stress UspA family protein